jgi:hypothetical protein
MEIKSCVYVPEQIILPTSYLISSLYTYKYSYCMD